MKYNLKAIGFDKFFKVILLICIGYFLFLLTIIVRQIEKKSEVGRYQFHNEGYLIIDTKTGVTKHPSQ